MLEPIPLDIPAATEALIERYAKDAVAGAAPANQTAIVVDFGSHTMRCGWAGESNPHVAVQSVVSRVRPKYGTGSLRPVVGALGEDAVPSFDTSRGAYVFEDESSKQAFYLLIDRQSPSIYGLPFLFSSGSPRFVLFYV